MNIENVCIYDIETYPNVFTFAAIERKTMDKYLFEISWRKNQTEELIRYLMCLAREEMYAVGFNNEGFDYPVLHHILQSEGKATVSTIFAKAKSIIDTPYDNRFVNVIWEKNRYVKQLDLFKIHHFDNVARATSLKVLEFNMKMDTIEDLPYAPGSFLTYDQIDELIKYNFHDVEATLQFYEESLPMVDFRRTLSLKYGRDMMNFNDTKIGKDFLISELEKHSPGCCYITVNGRRALVQTSRSIINFRDILLDTITFRSPEFQKIYQWFLANSIRNTKGDLCLETTYKGFTFQFGTGGLHGSISPCTVVADDEYMILDIDVTSYYPSIGIVNRFYPEHLGDDFCTIYADLKKQRVGYKKGTPENKMLKLALNGTYGDSNSEYSPIYDPQYTMSITINGQLQLCQLAEALLDSPDLFIIQANTDGLTIKFPRKDKAWVKSVMKWWENLTGYDLEEAEYSRFFVRDVNNYIAEYTDGKLKRKGAYEYNMEWHKDQSALVVQKAAEAALVHGEDIRYFIENHEDIYDFLLRTKVPHSGFLVAQSLDGVERVVQNVTRYHINHFGEYLFKMLPPTKNQLAKNPKAGYRKIGIASGETVQICNNIKDANPDDIEFERYINEAYKLVNPILKGGIK